MQYNFNDTDQPTIFLKELNLQNSLITTTLATPGTSKSTKETTTLIRRVIFDIQVNFITPGPIPSESHVLQLVDSLLGPHLRPKEDTAQTPSDPVSYVNASYEKTSDNSYVLKFGFEISNPSMAEKLELRHGNYTFIRNSMKRKLNQILSDSDTSVELNKVNFVNNSMEVIANVDYVFLQQDIKSPSVFIQELLKVMNKTTTTTTPAERGVTFYSTELNNTSTKSSVLGKTNLPLMNRAGSALVASKLLFNSSPVPSETQVLNVINNLLKSRESQFNKSVQVLNVTYKNISANSYTIIFTLNLINISISEDPELKGNTYQHLQNVINNVLNTLLNEPGSKDFEAMSSKFTIRRVIFDIQLNFITPGPIPSESHVLQLVDSLLAPRLRPKEETAQTPSDPVSYVNASYEKTSDNSYVLKFGFEINNPSMAEKLELRDGNYAFIQNSMKRKLNQILSDSDTSVELNKVNFVNNSMEVIANVDYVFLQQDIKSPSVFIQELLKVMNKTITTATPAERGTTFYSTELNNTSTKTSVLGKTNLPLMNRTGSALVASKLLFNSSPVPSETQVLNVINNLLKSRESQLNKSVQVLNVTYKNISANSYTIIFTFNLINISISEDPELKGNTYQHPQNVINNVLNTLLNEPGSKDFEAMSSKFTCTENHIEGSMEYIFNDTDQPTIFLKDLNLQNSLITTTLATPGTSKSTKETTTLIRRVIFDIQLNFITPGPIPSESHVLQLVDSLLAPRLRPKEDTVQTLSDPVSYVNASYKKTSDNSYVLKFGFEINNPSMAEKLELRDSNNNSMEVIANVDYVFLQQDIKSPSVFIQELLKVMNIPSETQVLNVINNLLKSRESQLNRSVQVLNVTCKNISTTSYAIIFTFNLINISISEDPELKRNTYQHLQNVINKVLNTLLNEPGSKDFEAKSSKFTIRRVIFDIQLNFITPGPIPSESHVLQLVDSLLAPHLRPKEDTALSDPVSYVNASYEKTADNSYALKFGFEINNPSMEEKLELRDGNYTFIQNVIKRKLNQILSDSDTSVELNKVNFVNNFMEVIAFVDYVFLHQDIKSPSVFIQELLKVMNGLTTPIVDKTTQNPEETPNVIGRVIIYIRLIFITQGPIPSEAKVLQLANSLLATRLRTKRELRAQILATPLNEILTEPTATPFVFNDANFTINSTTIQAEVQYVFSESDIQKPSAFLYAVILVNNETITTTTPAATSTPFYFTVLNTTITNNSTSAAWVVGIIVPCAIAIFLVPCWILLCCLLCGCCTAIRRRWSRRRSYNVNYTTRNSLF
ncbi:hypothetical protein QQF64_000784 [Cirrhinus molitorella]|uniref:Uncharacterized protein n=1 Tax=Cirrhinus molitorella TaxID=172907 RepID=A0ABR3NYC8_9TELE